MPRDFYGHKITTQENGPFSNPILAIRFLGSVWHCTVGDQTFLFSPIILSKSVSRTREQWTKLVLLPVLWKFER